MSDLNHLNLPLKGSCLDVLALAFGFFLAGCSSCCGLLCCGFCWRTSRSAAPQPARQWTSSGPDVERESVGTASGRRRSTLATNPYYRLQTTHRRPDLAKLNRWAEQALARFTRAPLKTPRACEFYRKALKGLLALPGYVIRLWSTDNKYSKNGKTYGT
jgi:hypothetical protein